MSRAHSPIFPSLHLRDRSFSNPSVALPTSQLILQPFCCFTYVTVHSPTLLSLLLRHKLFTYVTWRAAQCKMQRTIFLTTDYETPNSRDTARPLVAEFGARSARSATAKAFCGIDRRTAVTRFYSIDVRKTCPLDGRLQWGKQGQVLRSQIRD